jgi:hypothetical protein
VFRFILSSILLKSASPAINKTFAILRTIVLSSQGKTKQEAGKAKEKKKWWWHAYTRSTSTYTTPHATKANTVRRRIKWIPPALASLTELGTRNVCTPNKTASGGVPVGRDYSASSFFTPRVGFGSSWCPLPGCREKKSMFSFFLQQSDWIGGANHWPGCLYYLLWPRSPENHIIVGLPGVLFQHKVVAYILRIFYI